MLGVDDPYLQYALSTDGPIKGLAKSTVYFRLVADFQVRPTRHNFCDAFVSLMLRAEGTSKDAGVHSARDVMPGQLFLWSDAKSSQI